MAKHIFLKFKNNNTIDEFYVTTSADDVKVTPSGNIPSGKNTLKKVLDALGALAFADSDTAAVHKTTNDTITGIPNFANGFKIGGKSVTVSTNETGGTDINIFPTT